jgi:hypothetical protein
MNKYGYGILMEQQMTAEIEISRAKRTPVPLSSLHIPPGIDIVPP